MMNDEMKLRVEAELRRLGVIDDDWTPEEVKLALQQTLAAGIAFNLACGDMQAQVIAVGTQLVAAWRHALARLKGG